MSGFVCLPMCMCACVTFVGQFCRAKCKKTNTDNDDENDDNS